MHIPLSSTIHSITCFCANYAREAPGIVICQGVPGRCRAEPAQLYPAAKTLDWIFHQEKSNFPDVDRAQLCWFCSNNLEMNLPRVCARAGMIALSGFWMVAMMNAPAALAQSNQLPQRVRQATPEKVVAEHLAAFSSCDWKRLMTQFPDNVEFFAPNGQTVIGRKALGEMFAKVVKPPAQGGTCGLKITAEHTFVVGDTVNVQWRADAPFLAEPYRGTDAYETKDGFMAAQVTTFDAAALKMKH